MTQDEINQMVEQAGFHGVLSIGVVMDLKQLETFTKLVELRYQKKIADLENIICQRHWDVLQEREACALICDEHADDPVYCGEAIRARGERA
jgi:aminoglycoside phosphotransferase family enzyme